MTTDESATVPIGDRVYPSRLRRKESDEVALRRKNAGSGQPPPPEGRLPRDTVGLALSGGGIRSATFCLGMLQALARHDLLPKIDFLSTVSGGGYIGGFLGRMFTRTWTTDSSSPNCEPPKVAQGQPPHNAESGYVVARVKERLADPCSKPLDWLRQSGRYMSPNGAGDTIRSVAEYLRNWLAIQVVLTSFLALLFVSANLIRAYGYAHPYGPEVLYHGLPRAIWWSPYVLLPLFPLLLCAVPAGWAYWLTQRSAASGSPRTIAPWVTTLLLAAICVGFLWLQGVPIREPITSGLIYTVIAGALVLLSILSLGFFGIVRWRSRAIAAVPERWERDRLSSWAAAGLIVTGVLLVFALVDSLGQTIYAVLQHREFQGREISLGQALAAVASATGLTVLIALGQRLSLWLGKLPERGSKKRIPMAAIAIVLGFGVALLSLVTVSTAAHAIAWRWAVPYGDPGRLAVQKVFLTGPDFLKKNQQLTIQNREGEPPQTFTVRQEDVPDERAKGYQRTMSFRSLGWAWMILLGLSIAFGRTFGFINLSSHQTLYGSRLTRAYLGASNPGRFSGAGQKLTDVINCDGIGMRDYRPQDAGGPLHLINVTVNQTLDGKSQTEVQDRKGLPMAIGPCGLSVSGRHHALWMDETDSNEPPVPALRRRIESLWEPEQKFHALAENDIKSRTHTIGMPDLGTWVSVSGAAFTTGLGSRTNLGLSLLLGFANVRLGYWWDSGVEPMRRTTRTRPGTLGALGGWLSRGFPVQTHLFDEFLARFHGPARRRWYLSDGGHFENTGVYELIRRRLPYIICCDDGADPGYKFDDLGELVRKARLDFNAEIRFAEQTTIDSLVRGEAVGRIGTLDDLHSEPLAETKAQDGYALRVSKTHATLAQVWYDGADEPGSLILFIKPSLVGTEPQDVLNYARSHGLFPQEPTVDQYFDEAQWESYRKLGEHIGDHLFGSSGPGIWPWRP
jgi:hypothetical protein